MMELDRRSYLTAAGVAAASTVGLAGCTGTASATGTLATQVTDQPGDIADFESCVVTMQGIWVKPAEGDDTATTTDAGETADGPDADTATETVVEQDEDDVDGSDARQYHEFDEPQEADLVQLQDGNTDLVDER